jgi:hypothetical protein
MGGMGGGGRSAGSTIVSSQAEVGSRRGGGGSMVGRAGWDGEAAGQGKCFCCLLETTENAYVRHLLCASETG